MKLLEMRPGQIHEAVRGALPLILGCGVVEYHGPHLPVGTDYLIASSIVEEVERRAPEGCVLAPGLPFGPTGSWAGGAEDGEIDLTSTAFFAYIKPIFKAYLDMGFTRILVCQHHQGPEGPQSLCLRRAAAELALEQGYREGGGPGWGRAPHDQKPGVFGRIRIHAPASFVEGEQLRIPWGHGSYGETEYIRCVFPATVDMSELQRMTPPLPSWLESSHTSDGMAGKEWFDRCVSGWLNTVAPTCSHLEKEQ